MINGASINGAPINGAALDIETSAPLPTPEPSQTQTIYYPEASGWRLMVMINGVDLSARLVGRVSVKVEESAARLAELALIPLETIVEPLTWTGRNIEIYSVSLEGETETITPRFAGKVASPAWNANEMVLSLTCSDRYKETLEGMGLEAIDSLVGGTWRSEIHGDVESHYEYARQRLESVPGALDMGVDGELRLTAWRATDVPHFYFGPDSVLDDTVSIDLMSTDDLYNRVIITTEYRYTRLRQRNHGYVWEHPDRNFCQWRAHTASDLPNVSMVTEALTGAGWALSKARWSPLPPSGSLKDLCPPAEGGWINPFTADPHILGFNAEVFRRIGQTVTETLSINVQCSDSIAAFGEQILRESYSAETEYDPGDWEDMQPVTITSDSIGTDPDSVGRTDAAGDLVIDVTDLDVRGAVIRNAYDLASTTIKASHRATRVNFETLIPPEPLDVIHTARIEASGCTAQGKIFSLNFVWDMDTGQDTVSVALAISAGYGQGAPAFTLPDLADVANLPTVGAKVTELATQLAVMGNTEKDHDEDLDGYSGNTGGFGGALSIFPQQFQITTPEIDPAFTDEMKPTAEMTYEVITPGDPLVMDNEP
jgi:hypothetical protein